MNQGSWPRVPHTFWKLQRHEASQHSYAKTKAFFTFYHDLHFWPPLYPYPHCIHYSKPYTSYNITVFFPHILCKKLASIKLLGTKLALYMRWFLTYMLWCMGEGNTCDANWAFHIYQVNTFQTGCSYGQVQKKWKCQSIDMSFRDKLRLQLQVRDLIKASASQPRASYPCLIIRFWWPHKFTALVYQKVTLNQKTA